jgi:monoamine oxidase
VDGNSNIVSFGHGILYDKLNRRTITADCDALSGTGWYDQSLTEAVLEHLDFETPEEDNKYWWCVDGGAEKIAEAMRAKIKKPNAIKFDNQVVAIDANIDKSKPRGSESLTVTIQDNANGREKRNEDYFIVVNSTTLGSADRMDLSKAGLLWDTKQAIRCLGYGASCKVGIKFRNPWWMKEPFNIKQGGIARTDRALQVCVYPSYNTKDSLDKPAVLLVSYTWGQEAQRLASLISSDSPNNEEEIKNLLLRNLAELHANEKSSYEDTLALISGLYDTHHSYDWYRDPTMAGAFAYFGPGQFWDLYPAITKPNTFGQLYFVGEASSAHHAWVVGALESVVRALWYMFDLLHQASKRNGGDGHEPYKKAMGLLEKGLGDHPSPSPFYPLPRELPKRQQGVTTPADKLKDHTGLDGDDEADVMFGAALSILSIVESVLDNWGEEQ